MIERFSEVWCKTMHRGAMWPIHGKYVCPKCLREFTVDWSEQQAEPVHPAAGHDDAVLRMPSNSATAMR